jgi:hypothetical protein
MNRRGLAALAFAPLFTLLLTLFQPRSVLAARWGESGPAVAESQRARPAYEYGSPFGDVVLGEAEIPTEYVAASALMGGLNLTTSYLNVRDRGAEGSPAWAGYAGVLGGLAGIGLGGVLLVQDDYKDASALGVSNLIVGTFSTIAGLSSITRARKASGTASAHSESRHVSIAPAFHGGMAPGIGVRLRF